MSSLRTSNFRRIDRGLLLELFLLLAMPVILAALLALIVGQLAAAAVNVETVTVQTLLSDPSLAVRAFYALLAFQYCAVALCALLVVSGLGELESDVPELRRAKRLFLALMLTEAVAMLTHITSLLLPQDVSIPATVVFLVSVLLLLVLRAAALHRLTRGFAEVLARVGSDAAAARAQKLSRRIVWSAALLLALLLGSVVLWLLDFSAGKRALFLAAAAALVFHVVVRVQLVGFARQTTRVIASISE